VAPEQTALGPAPLMLLIMFPLCFHKAPKNKSPITYKRKANIYI